MPTDRERAIIAGDKIMACGEERCPCWMQLKPDDKALNFCVGCGQKMGLVGWALAAEPLPNPPAGE